MKRVNYTLILIFNLMILTGHSQEPNDQNASILNFDKSGRIEYIKFDGTNKTGKWDSPASPSGFFSGILGVQSLDEFKEKNKTGRKDGSFYLHYRQQYKGIEVEGGIYILHFCKGKLTKANGHYVNTTGIDTSPKLTPDEAGKSYAQYLKMPNNLPEKFLHGIVITEIRKVSGKDTVYNARLCYKIDFIGVANDNGETGYIDAQTGDVLKTQKRNDNISATGTFSTLYSATRNAGTQHYNNTYNLCDSTRTTHIHTWNLNNNDYTTYSSNGDDFTDSNNIWTEAEHSINNDQMALDIHWAFQQIFDYFVSDHGLHSFDGNNHAIDAFVHAVFDYGDKDNAGSAQFVNGDQPFFFGDGQTTFKPVAALDVVSHEFAHGITRSYTGLVRDNDVQSAMNEGFSDIWGAIVEAKVAPEKSCWKIGEEIIKVSGQDCLRNIQNPESTTSNTKIADTYGDNVYTTGNFYAKSGVMSHWFYLLANGGSGTNHNNVNYTVYGLGLDEAARVVFEGQTGHFANVTSYAGARTAMVDAANILYGANSFQSLQVANAWYAVGVGTNPGQVTLSGADLVCSSGSTFTANNPPSGSTISWSVDPNLLELYSGGSSTTPAIRAKTTNTSGLGTITVNFTSNGITTQGPAKDVWVGVPDVNGLSIVKYMMTPNCVTPSVQNLYQNTFVVTNSNGSTMPIQIENSFGAQVYNVNTTSPTTTVTMPMFYITKDPGNTQNFVYIKARISNECGWSDWKTIYLPVCSSGYYMSVSPNPASGEATIELQTELNEAVSSLKSASLTSACPEWSLEVYNQTGVTKTRIPKIKDKTFKLNIQGWEDGIYLIRTRVNDEIVTGKLVVKR